MDRYYASRAAQCVYENGVYRFDFANYWLVRNRVAEHTAIHNKFKNEASAREMAEKLNVKIRESSRKIS